MTTNQTLGELRLPHTPGDSYAETFVVPLLRLRRYDRPVIEPADCRLGPSCLVCQWRRAGLLDPPAFAPKPTVREPGSAYTCRSSYCPGCNAVHCVCPPAGHEDELAEQAYALGYDHGLADGPENRPDRRWLVEAGLEALAEVYYEGYDDACGALSWPAGDLGPPSR